MSKQTKKTIGRPRIHLQDRKRKNLNIERSVEFDGCLQRVRAIMAEQDGVNVEQITQTKAVRYAIYMVANHLPVKLPSDRVCSRCNGVGYITMNWQYGDDDKPCPECEAATPKTNMPY